MPPKKKSEPSKKTVTKQKEKVIEDKTFGLKNKKGKKQQTFIKQVTQQVKYGGHMSSQKLAADQHDAKKKKLAEQEQRKEMDSIFRPAASQKISAGADPKSVLCVFYKQGMCTKGDKCKFSHDIELERKAEKKSMYVDSRDLEDDTIDKWDEDKLKEVVEKKHGGKVKPKTDIVCKYFLKAIEEAKYGWFWECPNGGQSCMYRHALPPGFVFKTKKKPDEGEGTKISLEQLVEEEREKLLSSGKALTKVTLESFLAWKKKKLKDKQNLADDVARKKKEAFKAGKTHGISGREMFEFNPNLVDEGNDDEDDGETVYFAQRQEDGEEDGDQRLTQPLVDVTNFTSPEGFSDVASRLEDGGGKTEEREELRGAVGGVEKSVAEGGGPDEKLFSAGDLEVDESLFDVDELDLEEEDEEQEDD